MTWMLIVAAMSGVLTGLRYRASAMLVASLVAAAVGAALSLAGGATLLSAVIDGAAMLAALQAAYLATLTIPGCLRAVMRSRAG